MVNTPDFCGCLHLRGAPAQPWTAVAAGIASATESAHSRMRSRRAGPILDVMQTSTPDRAAIRVAVVEQDGLLREMQDPIDLGALASDGGATPADAPTPAASATTASGGGSLNWSVWLPAAAAIAFVLALGVGARLAWDGGQRGLDEPARFWRKTQRLARWARVGGTPSETPREFAERLRREVRDVAPVSELAGAYERTTFGAKRLDEDEREHLHDAWRAVRNRLLARVLHRA